jgi:hypothetical protein
MVEPLHHIQRLLVMIVNRHRNTPCSAILRGRKTPLSCQLATDSTTAFMTVDHREAMAASIVTTIEAVPIRSMVAS